MNDYFDKENIRNKLVDHLMNTRSNARILQRMFADRVKELDLAYNTYLDNPSDYNEQRIKDLLLSTMMTDTGKKRYSKYTVPCDELTGLAKESPYKEFTGVLFVIENITAFMTNVLTTFYQFKDVDKYGKLLHIMVKAYLPHLYDNLKDKPLYVVLSTIKEVYGKSGNIDHWNTSWGLSAEDKASVFFTMGVGICPKNNTDFIIPLDDTCPVKSIPVKFSNLRALSVKDILTLPDRTQRQVFWTLFDLAKCRELKFVEQQKDENGTEVKTYIYRGFENPTYLVQVKPVGGNKIVLELPIVDLRSK